MASDALITTGRFISQAAHVESFSVPQGVVGILQFEINEQAPAGGLQLEDSFDGGATYHTMLVRDMAGSFFTTVAVQGVFQTLPVALVKPRFNIFDTGDFTIIWSFAPMPPWQD